MRQESCPCQCEKYISPGKSRKPSNFLHEEAAFSQCGLPTQFFSNYAQQRPLANLPIQVPCPSRIGCNPDYGASHGIFSTALRQELWHAFWLSSAVPRRNSSCLLA